MKRTVSLIMLMVLLAATLAACGGTTPATEASAAASAEVVEESAEASAETAEESAEASVEASTMASEEASAAASTMASEEASAAASAEASEAAGSAEASAAGSAEASTSGGTETGIVDVSDLNITGVKIASQTPLSGPQSALGTGIRNGVELAIEQLAAQSGIEITLAPFDDQALPDVGASNANQIAADPDVLCVAGHLNSGVALAALPTYKNASLTMISPANTNVRITDEFAGTAYRVVGRDDVQAPVAAEFAAEQGYQNVYVLNDKTDYGIGVAEAFRTKAEELGLTIVGFEGTDEKTVFDSVLNPILAAQPDAVLWGGIYSEGGPLLKQMREKGIEAAFLGTDGLDNSELARLAGEAAIGVQYTTVAGPPSEYPAAATMAEDYTAKFGAPAPAFAPQGYDAAGLCIAAIAKAAETAGAKPTREQVNAAMKELGEYNGVTGPIAFDEKGDRSPATYFILEVTSSDPAEFGNSDIVAKLDLGPTGEAQ